MNTKTIKQTGMSVLALSVVLALGACSSKPSPWSQQASPWEDRQGAEEEVMSAEDMAAEEQSPFVDDAASAESSGIAEPVADEMAYAEPMAEEPAMEEPVMEESVMMEEEPVEAEPVMAASVTGGSIASQPAEYFALQVVASSNMENLKAFASMNQFSEEWVAETSVDGKTWYVLLQGVYPTNEEAKAALEQVSLTLETSPWIRSIGSLQAVMIQ